jgi:CRISPR-associated protein Cas2
MFYVVAYDITDNKRRNKLSRYLKGFCFRNQFSLFECHLDQKRYNLMEQIIESTINKKEDNIKIYYLCKDCFKKIKTFGISNITEEKKIIIV